MFGGDISAIFLGGVIGVIGADLFVIVVVLGSEF